MNDRILEASLEEVLGGVQLPDLTDRVVAALSARRSGADSLSIGAALSEAVRGGLGDGEFPPHFESNQVDANAVPRALSPSPALSAATLEFSVSPGGPARISPARREAKSKRRSLTWLSLALAASLLFAIGAYWMLSSHARQQIGNMVATNRPKVSRPDAKHPTKEPTVGSDKPNEELAKAAALPKPTDVEEVPAPVIASGAASPEPNDAANIPATDNGLRTTDSEEIDASTAGNAIATSSLPNALSTSATTDDEVIAFINASLKSHWKEAGVRPSPTATESEWCRRVYLDTIGRIPTIDELEAFLVDNARNKRARLIERLLTDDRYVESYARFSTTAWTNLLIGRKGGMEPNSPVNRAALQQYLRRAFLHNKPYNQLVFELISAQGSNRPGDDDYNGAVNFLLAHLQERATPATAKTAQIFLGLQVQCTQCHNHPFNDWKQSCFWELNSFFRQVREERQMQGNQLQAVRLTDGDFSGEGGNPREAEVYFELRNGILQVAYPTFIDGTAIDPNGLVAVVNRRRELAQFVIRSDEMKRAIVSRLWAQFLGYGFTKPVDDLGPHNPPSHPELLARLADEFAGHGYDLKRLIRWIVLSDAYGLSSKFGPKLGNAADDPTMGSAPPFSHFYVRQMSAEQLYDSLLIATGAHRTQGNYEEQQRLKDQWLEQFAIAFGTDENDEATTFDGTIAQTLVMMNGELTRKATSGETGSFLSQISLKAQSSERAKALNELYLAALARRPSRAEVQVANNLLTVQSGNTTTALEDIWWALLNSNEFILNH
jgi:hypothetical protein